MYRVTPVSESWHIHEWNSPARMLCSSQHTHTHTCTILQPKCVEEAGKHTTRTHTHEAPSRTHARALVRARSLSLSLVLVRCLSYIRTYALSPNPIAVARARSLSACVCVRLSRSLALSLLLPPLTFSRSLTRFLSSARFLSLPPRLPLFLSSHVFSLPPLQPKQTGCPCILTRRFHGRRSCRPLQYTQGERERERLARRSSWLQGLYK